MVTDNDAGTAGNTEQGNGDNDPAREHAALKADVRRDATKIVSLLARVLSREDVAGDDADDVREAMGLAVGMDARTGRRDPTRRRRRPSSSGG